MDEKARTDFELSVCGLLQKHPLYDYRVCGEKGFRLSVLIIGSGEQMNILRDMILSNGQLLDTDLTVTIITDQAQRQVDALRKAAPDLERFIELRYPGGVIRPEWKCGTLCYEERPAAELGKILAAHPDCRYVLLCGTKYAKAAPAPGQLIARTEGTYIRACGETFGPDSVDEKILDIAYRLHYAYEKGNDPYITNREIRERFHQPYNYRSNIACALHVRSKIKSAGIDPSAVNSAAEEYEKKIEEDARMDGDLLERLAQLEHRRWCVSKAVAGRRKPETVGVIYGDDGSGTHSVQGTAQWHVALVPYGQDGKLCRHLTQADWTAEDPETISGLDELDRQTLRVHRQCAAVAEGKLRSACSRLEALRQALPGSLQSPAEQMEKALAQMSRGSRDAVFLYRYHRRALEARMPRSGPAGQLLKALEQDLGAPIEYLTRKDYKKQNLVLVGSIPFALSGWKSTVLVKLMAETVSECVAAAWQLEPGRILFVDTARTLEELKQLRRKAERIDRFLGRHCNQVKTSYHIFVPEKTKYLLDPENGNEKAALYLQDIQSHDPSFFGTGDWYLYPRPSLDAEDLRPRFVELMHEAGATSIDMTGGKPVLISLTDGYARNTRAGAFYIRDNRICNYYGARGMARQALDKGLSVQQLFDQTDAALIKRDDQQISDIFLRNCEALWRIAHAHAPIWYRFCQCYGKAYREKRGLPHPDEALRVSARGLHGLIDGEFRADQAEFRAIVNELLEAGLFAMTADGKCYQAISEEAVACLRDSGKILEYYLYCTVRNSPTFRDAAMSWMFRHAPGSDAAQNELDVICTSENAAFFISAKNVSPASLGKNNFLNYVCYEVGWLADRFGGLGARTILAAPNVPQFEGGKPGHLVRKAMSRGVYLLGDRCFAPGKLSQVLDRIDRGDRSWCEFLLEAESAG